MLGASLVTAALLGRLAVLGDSRGVLAPDKAQLLMDGELLGQGEFTLLMACTLDRLFAGLRPFWGRGPGGVRFTGIAGGARDLWRSLPGILRGRPGARVTEDEGYLSRNVKCAQLRMDCGFTVDGELVEPDGGRILSVTADDEVGFVRA